MFVEEEKIFSPGVLRVIVCSFEGVQRMLELQQDQPARILVEMFREKCETSGPDDPKSLSRYRIIHVSTERELNGAFGLGVQDVQDRDVLLILKKQSNLTPTRMVAAEEKVSSREPYRIFIPLSPLYPPAWSCLPPHLSAWSCFPSRPPVWSSLHPCTLLLGPPCPPCPPALSSLPPAPSCLVLFSPVPSCLVAVLPACIFGP
uniref:Uncharacterized protein n=1 Tax=Eptatretus burgeri TaxID=7764 RepID=A0A8C4Q0T3_EPTBU